MNLCFLTLGLKSSILWDFGSPDVYKLLKFQAFFESEILTLTIIEDPILTLNSSIETLPSLLR